MHEYECNTSKYFVNVNARLRRQVGLQIEDKINLLK